MRHVMIDLETFGTRPGSVLRSIGAVMFDPFEKELGAEFYVNIDSEDMGTKGFAFNPQTINWWAKRGEEAKAAFIDPYPLPIETALVQLKDFIHHEGAKFPWSHGSSFDLAHLDEVYIRLGIPLPWRYWNVRDTRTVFAQVLQVASKRGEMAPREHKREGTHHNALDDAKHQAKGVVEAYGYLFGRA